MTLTAREAKHLATCANSLEKLVRIGETQNINILAIHERLLEISGKLSKVVDEVSRFNAGADIDLGTLAENVEKLREIKKQAAIIRDANQLPLPGVVDESGKRYEDQKRGVVPNDDRSVTYTKHPEDLG